MMQTHKEVRQTTFQVIIYLFQEVIGIPHLAQFPSPVLSLTKWDIAWDCGILFMEKSLHWHLKIATAIILATQMFALNLWMVAMVLAVEIT